MKFEFKLFFNSPCIDKDLCTGLKFQTFSYESRFISEHSQLSTSQIIQGSLQIVYHLFNCLIPYSLPCMAENIAGKRPGSAAIDLMISYVDSKCAIIADLHGSHFLPGEVILF